MATLAEIDQEKQRVAERLARLDAERSKLAEQLNELEIAERVLSRFGAASGGQRRRGRPAQPEAAAKKPTTPRRGRGRAAAARQGPSLSDRALQAVGTYPQGATANELLEHLAREYGLNVRPNHLGIALQRHRRGGRLEFRDSRWFLPRQAEQSATAAP